MKKIIKWILKLCVCILLVVALWKGAPYLMRTLFGGPGVAVSSAVLTQTVTEMGTLTTLSQEETGVFSSAVTVAVFGDVQKVSAPYTFTISFGVDMREAKVETADGRVTVLLPRAREVMHSFAVTGDIEKSDFLYPLTETRYQAILNEQTQTLLHKYSDDSALLDKAWTVAQEAVEELLRAAAPGMEIIVARIPAGVGAE